MTSTYCVSHARVTPRNPRVHLMRQDPMIYAAIHRARQMISIGSGMMVVMRMLRWRVSLKWGWMRVPSFGPKMSLVRHFNHSDVHIINMKLYLRNEQMKMMLIDPIPHLLNSINFIKYGFLNLIWNLTSIFQNQRANEVNMRMILLKIVSNVKYFDHWWIFCIITESASLPDTRFSKSKLELGV